MESAEHEILSLLTGVSSIVHFFIAVAVLVLGLVVVRPLNNLAGLVFAGAAAGRIVGVGLSSIIHALRPKDGDMSTVMFFSGISTVIWLVTVMIFYGGVMFGAIKFAETHTQGGAR